MNHDATHCADCEDVCPNTCYRAQLTRDLKRIEYSLPVSWAMFKNTEHCPLYAPDKEG